VSEVLTRVGARLRDGTIKHYDVRNISDPQQARAFVFENVSAARVVVAVVNGGRPAPAPVRLVA
jgi:hypothetical protein